MTHLHRHDTVPIPLDEIRRLCVASSAAQPCPAGCEDGRIDIIYFGEPCKVDCGTCGGSGTVADG